MARQITLYLVIRIRINTNSYHTLLRIVLNNDALPDTFNQSYVQSICINHSYAAIGQPSNRSPSPTVPCPISTALANNWTEQQYAGSPGLEKVGTGIPIWG